MVPAITSLLVFASVTGLLAFGHRAGWRLLDRRAGADAARYEVWIDELFLGWTAHQARQAAHAANALIAAAFVVTFVLTGSLVFALAAAFAAYFVPTALYRVARAKRLKRFEEQLPDAVQVMVASVRAGRSLAQAIEDVAEKLTGVAAQEFGVIAAEYRHGGVGIEEALRRTRDRLGIESFTMVSSALIINSERGGDVMLMLERISTSIREITRLKKKIVSEMAEVRAQQRIVLVLTPLFGGLVCVADPTIPEILFGTLLGNMLLVLVLAVQTVGILWIRRIVRSSI
jgi:tight adherence protein B